MHLHLKRVQQNISQSLVASVIMLIRTSQWTGQFKIICSMAAKGHKSCNSWVLSACYLWFPSKKGALHDWNIFCMYRLRHILLQRPNIAGCSMGHICHQGQPLIHLDKRPWPQQCLLLQNSGTEQRGRWSHDHTGRCHCTWRWVAWIACMVACSLWLLFGRLVEWIKLIVTCFALKVILNVKWNEQIG